MSADDDEVVLAGGFPAADRQDWQRLVGGVLAKSGRPGLAGEAAEEAIASEAEPGLRVQALYTAADAAGLDPGWPGLAPFTRGGRAPGAGRHGAGQRGWQVRQRHGHRDPQRTNAAIHADLGSGVTSLWLALGEAGLPPEALPEALAGVDAGRTGIALDAGAEFAAAAGQLLALFEDANCWSESSLGADPLGVAARTGRYEHVAAQLAEAGALAARCSSDFPGVRAIVVDVLPYHEAGATAAQELGLSLSTGVAYLRALTDEGRDVSSAAGQLEFRYAATADQFLSIAKLRAARYLWSRVAGACGVDLDSAGSPAAQRQHAVTAAPTGADDPWISMLRATVGCLAAGLGGADAVTVLPAAGLPDADGGSGLSQDLARRIARNTQAILRDESHLGQVTDPAGGSWYVERLTDDLARAAWSVFQEVERAGGHLAALCSGLTFDRIAGNASTVNASAENGAAR